jgi:hypothetical protein
MKFQFQKRVPQFGFLVKIFKTVINVKSSFVFGEENTIVEYVEESFVETVLIDGE